MKLKNYLLPIGACIWMLVVFLAPGTIDDIAPRSGFILAAVFCGYFYLRYRFRVRFIRQPRNAFHRGKFYQYHVDRVREEMKEAKRHSQLKPAYNGN